MEVMIYYEYTKNLGEEYDDEDNFCGHKTLTTLECTKVKSTKIYEVLESLGEITADHGDGITNAKVIAIIDANTKEILPKIPNFWRKR